MKRTDTKIRKVMTAKDQSVVEKYKMLVVGKHGWIDLIKYEIILLSCSWIPGALGLFLRSKFYPFILGSVGRGVVFGANIVFRHPHKIYIGNDVLIDDNCLLDAKGVENSGIFIGDKVFVGRNTILSCKDGDIRLAKGVNIGFNCEIFSSSTVTLGEKTLLAAYCYLVGGGNYDINRQDIAFSEQDGLESMGGIQIGSNCWLGAAVKVLDGVTIGSGAVIGAGAVVRQPVPTNAIADRKSVV